MSFTDLDTDLERQHALNDAALRFIWRNTIKPLLTDAIVEEHRADPLGHHSPTLDMVLAYLRNDPLREVPRLVVVILKPGEQWAIGEVPWDRRAPVHVRPDTYDSVAEIEHVIFLERLARVEAALGATDTAAATD